MRRRAFLGLLGGAATWPVGAGAQQGGRVRRIGVLMNLLANDTVAKARVGAFQQGLQQLGWTEGRDLQIDYRWTAGGGEELRKYAIELVALVPDAILATEARPWWRCDRRLNCAACFVLVADPVGAGFVESLARPGGNATGFTPFEYSTSAKWLGTAERDRAKRDARRCAARADQSRRHRPVCWNPICDAVARLGVATYRWRCRCRRDRARNRSVRARAEWRFDRDGHSDGKHSPRVDHRACGAATDYRRFMVFASMSLAWRLDRLRARSI